MEIESFFERLRRNLKYYSSRILIQTDAEKLMNFDHETELMKAIRSNSVKQLKTLLEQQVVDVNKSVMDNLNLSMLCFAVSLKKREVAKLLLAWNADVNFQDDFNVTPVMKAIAVKDNDTLELLLQKPVDLFLKDDTGRTAFDYAEFYENRKAFKMLKHKIDFSEGS
jgi:ankyrin repeat protein